MVTRREWDPCFCFRPIPAGKHRYLSQPFRLGTHFPCSFCISTAQNIQNLPAREAEVFIAKLRSRSYARNEHFSIFFRNSGFCLGGAQSQRHFLSGGQIAADRGRKAACCGNGSAAKSLCRDLHLRDASVGQDRDGFGAGLPGVIRIVGTAVIKHIPLPIDILDAAVNGAGRALGTVFPL